jgi:hypothetical protein
MHENTIELTRTHTESTQLNLPAIEFTRTKQTSPEPARTRPIKITGANKNPEQPARSHPIVRMIRSPPEFSRVHQKSPEIIRTGNQNTAELSRRNQISPEPTNQAMEEPTRQK